MVAGPFDEGPDITERTSVTEDMMLNAAFRTSCEQPGFTMVRTWGDTRNLTSQFASNMTSSVQAPGAQNEAQWRNGDYLIEINLQLLNTAHVILIFNAQTYRPGISTRTVKLERPWVSVNIIHQKFSRILPQKSAWHRKKYPKLLSGLYIRIMSHLEHIQAQADK